MKIEEDKKGKKVDKQVIDPNIQCLVPIYIMDPSLNESDNQDITEEMKSEGLIKQFASKFVVINIIAIL